MKATPELRYVPRTVSKNYEGLKLSIGIEKLILQQKWEDESGSFEWRDIPVETPEELKKAA